MARPDRYDLDYFPHKCGHGGRMIILMNKFQHKGYVAFFMILERLGKNKFHFIDLNDDTDLVYLEASTRIDADELMDIIKECVRLKL